jgi:hypothetical protein
MTYEIQMTTGLTWSETNEFFKKELPMVNVWFSHTNGPALHIALTLIGFETDRSMNQKWVECFYPKLTRIFGSCSVIEVGE